LLSAADRNATIGVLPCILFVIAIQVSGFGLRTAFALSAGNLHMALAAITKA
jgi:hypothetical protein